VLDVRVQVPQKYVSSSFSCGSVNGIVYIDTERTKAIVEESLAREVIRHAQELRKKNNLEELQRVRVFVSESKAVAGMLERFRGVILNEVRADSVDYSGERLESSFEFQGEKIGVGISF